MPGKQETIGLLLVTAVTASLLLIGRLTEGIVIFDGLSPVINRQIAYQLATLAIALAFLGILRKMKGPAFRTYFRPGNLSAKILPEPAVGIKPGLHENWMHFGTSVAIIISLVTAVIIYFQLFKDSTVKTWAIPRILPFAIAFSLVNSFIEESITRFGVVVILKDSVKDKTIPVVSAALFGAVHYWGTPGGAAGVLAAAFLGWLLAKSILETRGIGWAWTIHFLQDVIIFSALLTV